MNTKVRLILGSSLVVILPALFVANVWQSFRFVRLQQNLELVQDSHLELLEENKRLIVGIAGLRSPTRVRRIAEENLGLTPVSADRVRRIEIDSDGDDRGR